MNLDLIVCGMFENAPILLKIDDSDITLVSDIKSKVSKTINIPERELILYFSGNILPDDTPLSQWKDMRSGAAVLVTATPLRITLQRYNSDIDVKFEVPRLAAPRCQTQSLFNFCLYKAGMPYRNDGKYVFIVDGVMLDKGHRVSHYDSLRDDFTILVTFLQKITYTDVLSGGKNHLFAPITLPSDCIDKTLTSEQLENEQVDVTITRGGFSDYATIMRSDGRSLQHFHQTRSASWKWKLVIQSMDGRKVTVELKNHFLTPVCELRQQISPDTNIRLTFGTTVLEDWDDEGNMMLLCSYPDLHDGATLCQINLTGAVRIKVSNREFNIKLHDRLHLKLDEHLEFLLPKFVFIEDPHRCTITHFMKILKNFKIETLYQTDNSGRRPRIQLQPSDNPIGPLIIENRLSCSYGSLKLC